MTLDTFDGPPESEEQQALPELKVPGVFMSQDYAEMAWDEERDAYSRNQRGEGWRNLNAQHMLRKHERRPFDYCNYLISGDKGVGKTMLAAMLAMLNYSQGMEVFSTASFLFGHRIEAMDVFTMAESLPKNCVVFVDEAHSVADRYAENSTRNRTLANSIALLRKNGVRLIFASVHEHAVAMSIKSEIDTLVYPAIYHGNGKYPDWCYVYVNLIGPQPFRGRREADNWGIQRYGGEVKKTSLVMPPHLLYAAGKVIDTWAKPDIAAGIMITAKDVRERLVDNDDKPIIDGDLETQFLRELIPVIRSGWNPETARVPWSMIASQVQSHGSKLDDATIRELCKRLFAVDNNGRVRPKDIFSRFNIKKQEPQGE